MIGAFVVGLLFFVAGLALVVTMFVWGYPASNGTGLGLCAALCGGALCVPWLRYRMRFN